MAYSRAGLPARTRKRSRMLTPERSRSLIDELDVVVVPADHQLDPDVAYGQITVPITITTIITVTRPAQNA
jgi:hypothetical protein